MMVSPIRILSIAAFSMLCGIASGNALGSTVAEDITGVTLTKRSASCADYVGHYVATAYDDNNNVTYRANLSITLSADRSKCIFTPDAIPNHTFNDGSHNFANAVSEQEKVFEIDANPSIASTKTSLTLQAYNGILLNGALIDLLAAACYGVGDGMIGCNTDGTPWRYDPASPLNSFRIDTHNAHAQPDGTYHYHGDPGALYDTSGSSASPVIGFAADGFPIFGPFYEDDAGSIRKAISGYSLKGIHTRDGGIIKNRRPRRPLGPGYTYDGTYRDDYIYKSFRPGSSALIPGRLDECNGMYMNGQYGYYVTKGFPYILNCFMGTPDKSFNK